MKISDNFYVDGYSDKKVKKLLNKISKSKKINGLYLVTLPLQAHGLLEIYIYNQLLQDYYVTMDDNINVLGLASSKEGAYMIVERLVQSLLDDGKQIDAEAIMCGMIRG